ncbi:hypothetical protein PIB30_104142, partial [Stylosanthes scabra]|nr:hypothetical protein [Stylosanthes scabra]
KWLVMLGAWEAHVWCVKMVPNVTCLLWSLSRLVEEVAGHVWCMGGSRLDAKGELPNVRRPWESWLSRLELGLHQAQT